GHVDHGKSTLVGRLLADTQTLPQGKLENVKAVCARQGRTFEYSFLIDALKEEQAKGITIDAARVFFKTAHRDYLIFDAPGHLEFLKNMVSGASHAEAALLVIDAHEGIRENSKRHAYMLSMLGIKQLAVLVNKMDLVGYSEAAFQDIQTSFSTFLDKIAVYPQSYIPISGFHGENVAQPSKNMPWYVGKTVLETLDAFEVRRPLTDLPFRFPVQDIYTFGEEPIVVGTIESGTVKVGDELVFLPSEKRGVVKKGQGVAGEAIGLTFVDDLVVARGEVACRMSEPLPDVVDHFRASLFWLGKKPMESGKDYILKLATARTTVRLEKILRRIDASSLALYNEGDAIQSYEVAEGVFSLHTPMVCHTQNDVPAMSRFVIVDDYDIVGGGIIRSA
ncbi:MAG: adenylyl-sulfate kinase, partial [Deltaproteobacteria bacterium]|nr:adenylyl-sulfate kinase [Deltaproteobacteria bacterium]